MLNEPGHERVNGGQMATAVSQHHPLRRLFGALTERSFTESLGWPDFNVTAYLSNLLVEFSHVDQLRHIKNQRGQPVETVAELLYESELATDSPDPDRERTIHRHIGDLTLFIAGLVSGISPLSQNRRADLPQGSSRELRESRKTLIPDCRRLPTRRT